MLESFWYETSPYLYSAGGALAISHAESPLAVASGALLLFAAGLVLILRRKHRKQRGKA